MSIKCPHNVHTNRQTMATLCSKIKPLLEIEPLWTGIRVQQLCEVTSVSIYAFSNFIYNNNSMIIFYLLAPWNSGQAGIFHIDCSMMEHCLRYCRAGRHRFSEAAVSAIYSNSLSLSLESESESSPVTHTHRRIRKWYLSKILVLQ